MSTTTQPRRESLADQLHSAAVHLLRRVRRTDAASGLNAPRLSALSVVVFGGPITLGALAEAEQVRPPTMTRIVNALEMQGLLTKERRADDRRNVYISATTLGKRTLLSGRNRRIQALAQQIETLDAADREILRNAVGVMRKMMRES